MSGVAGKPRQTRLHVLLQAVKSHKKRLWCGRIVDNLATIRTLQRIQRNRILQVLRSEVRVDHRLCNFRMTQDSLQCDDVAPVNHKLRGERVP